MTIPDNLDDAVEGFKALLVMRDEALDVCERQQAAGRTGFDAHAQAVALQTQINEFAAKLLPRIEEARRSL